MDDGEAGYDLEGEMTDVLTSVGGRVYGERAVPSWAEKAFAAAVGRAREP
ncbi:hypothetical protein AB0H34_23185 [Saccharopolyspora shandongensis]